MSIFYLETKEIENCNIFHGIKLNDYIFIINGEQHFVTDVMCYVTSAKGLTPVWVYNKLCHAEIIYEQNASKL